jgi:hypothetical protein
MDIQDVTLSIPKDVLLKLKVIAVKQGLSISELLILTLQEIVTKEEGYQVAGWRHLALLEEANLNLGTNGIIPWARIDLHDR